MKLGRLLTNDFRMRGLYGYLALRLKTQSNTVAILFFSIFPYIRSLQQDYLVYVVVVIVVVVVRFHGEIRGAV